MHFSPKTIERLKSASHLVVLTGAGMSAASGVPTFRGKDGLWNKFNPQELANMDAFLRNPELVWEWYTWRRKLIKDVKPNLGHFALVDLESFFAECLIITQNVDNLHQIAGSKKITELHGNIMRNKCIDCNAHVEEDYITKFEKKNKKAVPTCPSCGGLIRPDVVWFGELLPMDAIKTAQTWSAEADVFFSIGTSATVEPAASLPYLAKGNGAYLVEINPEETPLSSVAADRIVAGAHEALPKLIVELEKVKKRVYQ